MEVKLSELKDKIVFHSRGLIYRFYNALKKKWYIIIGMNIGKNTMINTIHSVWPNQISIGNNCKLERNIYFKYSGPWRKGTAFNIGNNVFIGEGCEFNITKAVSIGCDSLIASGCKFIDHDHGTAFIDDLIRLQQGVELPIVVGCNVWLGCNVIVLKGVQIGSGSIVAAGSVVIKSIPSNEIWGGVPAKRIRVR